MEDWQKQHIQANLVSLIKSTNCTAALINRLTSAKILCASDVEELQNLTEYAKSKKLYEILQTHVGAYEILLHCLQETQQTRAANILKRENALIRSLGSISYNKNQILGTGSLGTKVFKGLCGGRDVAVKVVNVDLIKPDVSLREVKMLKQIDVHENVVRYFTSECRENLVFIAYELCFISLQDEVKMNLLNLDPVYILENIAKGLAHLHNNSFVHGDMKPANILLSDTKQVKISDFGLSKQIPPEMTGVSLHISDVGTPDWMAPEVLQACLENTQTGAVIRVHTSADVFSLGCIFTFVLTKGLHPFGDARLRQHNICFNKPQFANLQLEHQWQQLIQKMICFQASSRPSCEDILSSNCLKLGRNLIEHEHPISTPSGVATASQYVSIYSPSPAHSKMKPNENAVTQDAIKQLSETLGHTQKKQHSSPFAQLFASTVGFEGSLKVTIRSTVDRDEIDSDGGTQSIASTSIKEHVLIIVKCAGDQMKLGNIGDEPVLHVPANRKSTCGLHLFVSPEPLAKYAIDFGSGPNEDLCCKVDDPNTKSFNSDATEYPMENTQQFINVDGYRIMCLDCGDPVIQLFFDKANLKTLFQIRSPPSQDGSGHSGACVVDNKMFKGSLSIEDSLTLLRERNLEVDTVDELGNNFLLFATASGIAKDRLEEIVGLGVDWRITNKRGRTVLHHAASCGNVDALKYFISLGADVTKEDEVKRTALHLTERSQQNFIETVRYLVGMGLDINAADKNGNSLIMLAIVRGKTRDELKEIVGLDGDWKAINQKGETVLHLSAAQGNIEALQYFIFLGADVNIRDVEQNTPGHRVFSAKSNVKESLRLLVENGLDVNAVDKEGHDLLLLAASLDRPKEELEYILKLCGQPKSIPTV